MNRDVRLRIETALPEKLIARALEAGAVFAEIRRESRRCLILDLDAGSAEILKRLCGRFGCDCRELRRVGCTALRESLRRRWTLLCALALCICICAPVLSRVWFIDVAFTTETGHPTAREQIFAFLEEMGVQTGVSKSRIDADLLLKELAAHMPEIGHIGVKLQGMRLLTEIAPLSEEPELYEMDAPRDLAARLDGVVDQVHVYSGRASVRPGDTVLRGDVLIRGEENIARDAQTGEMITRPVGALGEVIARCWYEGSAQGELKTTVLERTGQESRSGGIRLMDLHLPILEGEAYASFREETQVLPIGGMFLPLELARTTRYETRETEVSIDRNTLEAQLTALACADALRKISSAATEYEIASFWTDVTEKDNTLHVRAVYEIYTDIASDRDALIEEVY